MVETSSDGLHRKLLQERKPCLTPVTDAGGLLTDAFRGLDIRSSLQFTSFTSSSKRASAMSIKTNGYAESHDILPDYLSSEFTSGTRLTREQCGHPRHFYNLASSLDDEWALMDVQEPG